MDISIVVAVVGAIATMSAPLIGIAAAKWSRDRELQSITKDRKVALEGEWIGQGIQEVGPHGEGVFEVKVKAKFKVSNKEVIGEVNYQYELDGNLISLDMNLSGGFLYERYLQMHYKNQKESVMQFGSAVFELNSSATCLSGRFVGYGSISEGLVYGFLKLHKEP